MRDNCCSYMLCKNFFDCLSAIQSTAITVRNSWGGGEGGFLGKHLHSRGKNLFTFTISLIDAQHRLNVRHSPVSGL